jgi:hypothetical protein
MRREVCLLQCCNMLLGKLYHKFLRYNNPSNNTPEEMSLQQRCSENPESHVTTRSLT